MNLRRPAALLAVTALSGALVFATGTAASAIPVAGTVGDFAYLADDSNIAAGASVINYFGGPTATIPSTVTLGGNTYDVTSIGGDAFFDNLLTSVTIPATVTRIGPNAFQENFLTSVVIPDSVTTIGNSAFERNSLTSVTLGNSVMTIGTFAFYQNDLTSLTIPDSVTVIDNFAFFDNAIASVTLGNSLTTINQGAFYQNDLTSLTIPDSVTTIGNSAFRFNSLSSVSLGSSITSIGEFAFADNSVTSVVFPESVTSISEDAFSFNPTLTSATFLGAAPTTFRARLAGASLGDGTGLTVYYNWAFDAARAAGGFTAPTWQGYNTVVQATVAFNMSGRGTAPATQTVTVGGVVSEPAAPTSTGSLFTGWFTDAALTTKADFAGAVTSNITLFAGWTALAETGADITPMTIVVPGLLVAVGLGLMLLGRRKARISK